MKTPTIKRTQEIDAQIRKLRSEKLLIVQTNRKGESGFDPVKLRVERLARGYKSYLSFAKAIKAQGMAKASAAAAFHWERGACPTGPYLTAIGKVLGRPIEFFFRK